MYSDTPWGLEERLLWPSFYWQHLLSANNLVIIVPEEEHPQGHYTGPWYATWYKCSITETVMDKKLKKQLFKQNI